MTSHSTQHLSGKVPNLLLLGVVVEGGLVLLALTLGWLGISDHSQPLRDLAQGWSFWKQPLLIGLAATIPMLGYLLVFHFWTPGFMQPMQQFVDMKLKPMFKGASLLEMFALSLMAGFGEEIFFRWCLQGGITHLLTPSLGAAGAIAVGVVVASIVFGICHWVNRTYGVITIIVGAYLGMLMVWTGSWIVPAIAHALFDFVAMIYIGRWPVRNSVLTEGR